MITIGKSPPGMTEQEINEYREIMRERYPEIKDGTLDTPARSISVPARQDPAFRFLRKQRTAAEE